MKNLCREVNLTEAREAYGTSFHEYALGSIWFICATTVHPMAATPLAFASPYFSALRRAAHNRARHDISLQPSFLFSLLEFLVPSSLSLDADRHYLGPLSRQ